MFAVTTKKITNFTIMALGPSVLIDTCSQILIVITIFLSNDDDLRISVKNSVSHGMYKQ